MPLFDSHAYFSDGPIYREMATRDGLLRTFARSGIGVAALTSGLAAKCDFVAGNRRLSNILDPAAGLYGYVTMNVDYPDESLEEQRRYMARTPFLGAAFYGADGGPVTLESARDLLNSLRRYSKPTILSVPDADAVGHARQIAVEFPAMKFVWLSMGGEHWHRAVAAAKVHLNIYLEISGSLDSDKISKAAETLTPRKLLYGSSAPFNDPEATVALVESSPILTNADRNRVYYQNAAALFNIGG